MDTESKRILWGICALSVFGLNTFFIYVEARHPNSLPPFTGAFFALLVAGFIHWTSKLLFDLRGENEIPKAEEGGEDKKG